MLEELEALNNSWNHAWLQRDAVAVERMMKQEYVYIAPNGQLLDRESILGIIRNPTYQLTWGTRTEVSVKPLGKDAALVVHRWQGEGSFQGRAFKDDHRCTMVCVRDGNQWRVVHEQCSPMAP